MIIEVCAHAAFVVSIQLLSSRQMAIAIRTAKAPMWWVFGGIQQVAAPRLETMKIDRIYEIYRMSRKIISPVNLVNPVYFLRSLYVALRRPGRMKSAVRSPAFRRNRLASRNGSASDACGLKAGLRTATVAINRASKFNHRYATR